MATLLARIAGDTDPQKNLYVNEERAAALRARIDGVGGLDEAKAGLRQEYGYELLLAGNTEEAITEFEAVRGKLADLGPRANPKVVADVRRMLTLAYMRLGEQQNCLDHHTLESCLLPMRGGGVHRRPEGSRRALALIDEWLAERPGDAEARWLANVAAMTLGQWPDGVDDEWLIPPSAFASAVDVGVFPDVAAEAGVNAVGLAGGVCMEDFDGDGRLDLLVSSWGQRDPLRLFHNVGDMRFEERTKRAGLTGLTGGLNMVHADYDNDGDADVLVLRGAWFEEDGAHPNSLLRNDGAGNFVDVTEEVGLLSLHPTQTAAWGDYDGDGWLDLFIGNETGPHQVHRCELYHNDGGTFTEVAARVGLDLRAYVKGVAWADVDNDGDVDLYVSRIDGKNKLLRNDGPSSGKPRRRKARDGEPRRRSPASFEPWAFADVGGAAGVVEPKRSFPVWFFDYDNDGWLDIFTSGYRYGSAAWVAEDYLGIENKGVKARLYRNRGDGRFEDVSAAAGVEHVLLTMGCNYGDLDNDGWMDFYVATGEPDLAALYPNRMFRNDGDGRFDDVTTSGRFGHVQKGHGVAFGDLDGDGDQDVYAVMGGAYSGDVFPNALFRNPGHGHRWITLRLEGVEANRSAIGARVRVRIVVPAGDDVAAGDAAGAGADEEAPAVDDEAPDAGGPAAREVPPVGDPPDADGGDRGPDGDSHEPRTTTRDVHVVVGTGGSFGSASLQQEIGLGDALAIEEIEVRWPGSRRVQRFTGVPMDAVVKITEGAEAVEVVERR